MASLKSLSSNAAVLAGSQIGSQIIVFIRNLLIVRTLTPENFGIAATFLLALTLGQSFANFALPTLVVQAPDGEEPAFQRTTQFVQALQGAALGLLLLLTAPLIADMFGTPEATWCYRMLAVAAVAQGLIHFDPHRFKRRDRFVPLAAADLLPELASLLFVVAALPFIHDYTIALWAVICQNCSVAVATHLFAERRYGWAWERTRLRRIASFGIPMLFTSILSYVMMNGDRFCVASAQRLTEAARHMLGAALPPTIVFDKADLALFSIAVSLSLMPTTLIARVIGVMVFPVLTRNQHDPTRFQSVYATCALVSAVASTAAAVFLIIGGESVTALIYTERYRGVGAFIGWLAVIQALRLLRGSMQSASLAVGDSKLPLFSLLSRVLVFPLSIWVTVSGGSLADLAVTSVVGEGFALMTSLIGLNRRSAMPYRVLVPPILFTFAILAGGILAAAALPSGRDVLAIAIGVVGAASVPVVALAAFPRLRLEAIGLLRPPTTPESAPRISTH